MNPTIELILLRHAHAEPAVPGQDDRARPLSARGLIEARDAAQWLAGQARPNRIVHSPALRTRQTAEQVQQVLGPLETVEDGAIYEATPGELLAVVERHLQSERLLLVGHNPGLESLVALLATGQSGDHRGMSPGAIAHLVLPADAAPEPACARLLAYWAP